MQTSPWQSDEATYAKYLAGERRLFEWCLVRHGGVSSSEAASAAEQFYCYESPTKPSRGLVFHDEAWHWAMLRVFGEHYWTAYPELASPSAEYRAEASQFP